MAKITLKGNPFNTSGELPKTGEKAPQLNLTNGDLGEVSLNDYSGKKIILNIYPSIDTPVCAVSTQKFNEEVSKLDNTVVLCISRDLPFAQKRFCGAEEIENVTTLSSLRDQKFGEDYGVTITDGPLATLFARAIVVIDESGNVTHTELVPEIAQEPNYEAAIKAVS